jgi:hypothetical protein
MFTSYHHMVSQLSATEISAFDASTSDTDLLHSCSNSLDLRNIHDQIFNQPRPLDTVSIQRFDSKDSDFVQSLDYGISNMSSVPREVDARYHEETLDMEISRGRSTSKSDECTVFKPELFPEASQGLDSHVG